MLVDRKNPPYGNALPGGFIDLGESAEQAAVREAFEETNLRVKLTGLLGVYSAPDRDPRQHTISTVFIAEPLNPEQLRAGDDAAKVAFYSMEALPALVFDHAKILADFKGVLYGGRFSLLIGLCSTLIALFFGAIIGSIAAVVRKSFSEAIMRVMDIVMAVPGIAWQPSPSWSSVVRCPSPVTPSAWSS